MPFFDEALAWLDTTECLSDTIIAELPDSIYKQRLQALPFVIEVPYNEVVRRYILRYVKHSPRQLAALQRKAEYYFPIFENILAICLRCWRWVVIIVSAAIVGKGSAGHMPCSCA